MTSPEFIAFMKTLPRSDMKLTEEDIVEMACEIAGETNSTVDRRERRKALDCSHCPPNQGENAKRRGKHGKTKPKRKQRRGR